MPLICKGHPRIEQPTEGRTEEEQERCVVCGNELVDKPRRGRIASQIVDAKGAFVDKPKQ